MGHKIAILNQKGGVGKTTTAINLASYLHDLGRSILVVDMDPQGNSTSGLGIDKNSLDITTYDVLIGVNNFQDATKETPSGLVVLPTNSSLAAAEIELVGEAEREIKLKKALANSDYDYVIIDCPPALSLLTVNALAASDWVLIPVQAEYYALEGLSQLLDVVQRVRKGVNPDLEVLGLLMTMYDNRNSLSGQVVEEVEKHFGHKMLHTVIPRNVRLAEAPSFGRTISEHDKWSKGAKAYKQLAKEVEKRVNA